MDRLRPAAEPPRLVLSWDELRDVRRAYPEVELGLHSKNHIDLGRFTGEEARLEIEGCIEDFRRELGIRPQHFAFPYNRHAASTRELVRSSGLRTAMSSGESLLSHYAAGKPGWAAFESLFSDWATEARALTPRALVVLYPHIGLSGASAEPLRMQVALEHGCEVLDVQDVLAAAEANPRNLLASPFDAHPGAKGHAVIAAAITESIVARWPELREPFDAESPAEIRSATGSDNLPALWVE